MVCTHGPLDMQGAGRWHEKALVMVAYKPFY